MEKFFNYSEKATIKKPWLQYYTTSEQTVNKTVYRNLSQSIDKQPDKVILNYLGRKITSMDVSYHITEVAAALAVTGIKKRDVVTIAMPTTPEVIYLFYALNRIGAIANFVDPKSSIKELEQAVTESKSKLLFIIDEESKKIKHEANIVEEIITVSLSESLPVHQKIKREVKKIFQPNKDHLNFTNWKSFVARNHQYHKIFETPLLHEIYYRKDQPVLIAHTKSETLEPERIILTNDDINQLMDGYMRSEFDFNKNQTWMNTIPPFMELEFINGIHLPLIAGMELILIPKLDPNQFSSLVIKYKPNHIVAMPSHYQSLLQNDNMENQNLYFLKSPIVNGNTMSPKLETELNQFLQAHCCSSKMKKRYQISGAAEVVTTPSNKCNELGSVGIPLPHTTIGIFEPGTDKELDYGEIGELCIKTQKPIEKTRQIQHQDGTIWIHSDKLGYINENGLLFVENKPEETIVCQDGFYAQPKRIEKLLKGHQAIKDCMVIGIDDLLHTSGKLPKAYFTLNYPEPNIEGELELLCRMRLSEYNQPVEFEVCDHLPMTETGEHDYRTLEKEALKQQKNSLLAAVKQIQYIKK